MTPYDDIGRIHKRAFLISNGVLFGLCLVSACARYFIRIRLQKKFSIDDGILLFGIGCLIAAIAVLFTFVDKLYLAEAIESGTPFIELPPDFMEQAYDQHKLSIIVLILTWCSIVSVKFSYLFLFKKLIDRIPRMISYWWCVAAFTAVISAYGASVYVVACPYIYSARSVQCAFGKGVDRAIAISNSQMILDIISDLLILFIPCRLIWGIEIRWTQKVALSFSLCMTIITIICTIIRIAGIHIGHTIKSVDSVWETYWQFVAASLATTMTAATAFRTFFVSTIKERRQVSPRSNDSWYTKSKKMLEYALGPRSWRSQTRRNRSGDASKISGGLELDNQIPGAVKTGTRTFTGGQGKTKARTSHIMDSTVEEEYEDSWPLSTNKNSRGQINLGRDITLVSEDVC